MSWFNPNRDRGKPFSKNEIVIALADLPGVPAGTPGKIKMSNGFDWQRYWVFFNNGVQLGQIDKALLCRPKHKKYFSDQRLERATALAEHQVRLEAQKVELAEAFEASGASDSDSADDSSSSEESDPSQSSAEQGAAPEPAPAPQPAEKPASKGSALVDVPEHLLERAQEARTRLS